MLRKLPLGLPSPLYSSHTQPTIPLAHFGHCPHRVLTPEMLRTSQFLRFRFLCFRLISYRHTKTAVRLFASAILPATDTLDGFSLTSAPTVIRSSYALFTPNYGTSTTLLHEPSLSSHHKSCGSCPYGSALRIPTPPPLTPKLFLGGGALSCGCTYGSKPFTPYLRVLFTFPSWYLCIIITPVVRGVASQFMSPLFVSFGC